MERHKLWDDRAGKLMERTFEKFGYGKKKESVKEEIKESLEVQDIPAVQEITYDADDGNSLLDMDDYNMLAQAVEGPVEKLLADGYTKEDLVDAFKAALDMDQSEIDAGSVSQEVYTRIDKLKSHVDTVVEDEDAREYISDELLMILDKMDKDSMNEDETENPEVDRAEDAARKAKIKALQVQLKALRKTQSME